MSTDTLDSLEGLMDFGDFNMGIIDAVDKVTTEPIPEPTPVLALPDPVVVTDDDVEPVVTTEPVVVIDPEPVEPATDPKDEPSEGIQEYYNFLVENQMLMPNEDFSFDGTATSLSEAIKQSDMNRQTLIAQSLWDQLPDDMKPILKYGLAGGQDVESFLKTYRNNAIDIDRADLSDPSTKDDVLREYYRQTTKWEDNKIERHISQLKASGNEDYDAEVIDSALKLKDIQKTQREELTQQAIFQRQAEQEKARKDADELNKVIEEMNTTPQRKGMIKSFIYASDPNANSRMNVAIEAIIQNKEHYAQLADILLDSYDPKTGFNLENRFAKKGKTKALDDLEKQLKDRFSDSKTKVSGANSTSDAPVIDWSVIFGQ